MSPSDTTRADSGFDHDIVIVGGDPAGCSAGVFTARYGLDTHIFDDGRSPIQRCAFLKNYLGSPAGIDIEPLYGKTGYQARIETERQSNAIIDHGW